MIEPFLDALEESRPMFQFEAGQSYYIETFGKHYVGRVESVSSTTVTLTDAAWVAYSGRYGEFLRAGGAEGMEVEPVGEMELGLAYISAKMPWKHKLFREAV